MLCNRFDDLSFIRSAWGGGEVNCRAGKRCPPKTAPSPQHSGRETGAASHPSERRRAAPGKPGRSVGQQRGRAPRGGYAHPPRPRVPLGPRCRPSPACPLPPGLPSTVTGGAEGHGTADGLTSLAGAGGSTEGDYGGGGYQRGTAAGSAVGWEGWWRASPPPAAQHRALSAPQQARWRRRGRSPASPAPWPWRSSGPSPATSPTSRRSSASASSVSVVPSAPPATECLKGTEQAPTYLPPEPRCHFPAWSQEGVPGTQRPGAGRAKPQPWVIEPPQPRQALHRQEPTGSDGPRTRCHPGASTQPLTRTHSHSQRPNPRRQTG